MLLYLFIIFILILIHLSFRKDKDYLDRNNTLAINGIFVLLVFLSHVSSSIGIQSESYNYIKYHLDQAIVIPFLFFSGYGMMQSFKYKENYGKKILKDRLPKLFVHYNIAVFAYLLLSFILGKTYSLGHVLLSTIGWKSVGNSNWYIFVMLLLYVMLIIAYYLTNKGKSLWMMTLLTTLFSGIYLLVMRKMGIPPYFYNTIFTFSFGMGYALVKNKIDGILKKEINYWFTVIVMIGLYCLFYKLRSISIIFYVLWTITFMSCLLLWMRKLQINSPIFKWCGTHVFEIYILELIPFMILDALNMTIYPHLYIVISFIATIFLTILFSRILKKVDLKMER